MKLLNLGCGRRYRAGWVNVDFVSDSPEVIAANLQEGIPFEDNTFDLVYHSHVLEHFTKIEGESFIRECRRVLKPGGVIRIVVPDLEKITRAYLQQLELAAENPDSAEQAANYEWMVLLLLDQATRHTSGGAMLDFLGRDLLNEQFILDTCGVEMKYIIDAIAASKKSVPVHTAPPQVVSHKLPSTHKPSVWQRLLLRLNPDSKDVRRQEPPEQDLKALEIGRFRLGGEVHRWMYDRYSLAALLRRVGFTNAVIQAAGHSYLPDWASYHLDTEPDGSVYKPESLFLEAKK